MEDVSIFYGHLSILWPLGIFCGHFIYFMVIWYMFTHFGMFYEEKSGNPDQKYVSLQSSQCYLMKIRFFK
jgi:preprotein translocase subunit SecY